VKNHAKGKILVVEDDKGIAHLLKTRLERFGHTVKNAYSAQETLSLLDKEIFDLMVLDYKLDGDLNGLALFMVLRERGVTIPAILVTGFEDPKIILDAMRAGVRDFLPKTQEYLNDLPVAIERVMRQVSLEKEVAESAAIIEKQEQLQAAFEAARLGSWSWDIASDHVEWSGFYNDILGVPPGAIDGGIEKFVLIVHEEDRPQIENAFHEARKNSKQFEEEFRILRPDGEIRWILGKGRVSFNKKDEPLRMTGIIFDITEKREAERKLKEYNKQILALNDRLQLSMAETHHRVKNNLQNVISLLNLSVRKYGNLGLEEVGKVNAHIQGLATLHDILVGKVQQEGDSTSVAIDEVFQRLIEIIVSGYTDRVITSQLVKCSVKTKHATTLLLVLSELVSNAIKHGTGPILVNLEKTEDTGKLVVINEGSKLPENFNPSAVRGSGLLLIMMLCRSDLGCAPWFENKPGDKVQVTVTFPLKKTDPAHASKTIPKKADQQVLQ
jgi:PAS domain S-box-containing protein